LPSLVHAQENKTQIVCIDGHTGDSESGSAVTYLYLQIFNIIKFE